MVSLWTMLAMATALSSSSNVSASSAFTLTVLTSMAQIITPASAAPFEYKDSKYWAKRRLFPSLGPRPNNANEIGHEADSVEGDNGAQIEMESDKEFVSDNDKLRKKVIKRRIRGLLYKQKPL